MNEGEFLTIAKASVDFNIPESTIRRNVRNGFFEIDEVMHEQSAKRKGVLSTIVSRKGMARLVDNRQKRANNKNADAVTTSSHSVTSDRESGGYLNAVQNAYEIAIETLREANEDLRSENQRLTEKIENLLPEHKQSPVSDHVSDRESDREEKPTKTTYTSGDLTMFVIAAIALTFALIAFITF